MVRSVLAMGIGLLGATLVAAAVLLFALADMVEGD